MTTCELIIKPITRMVEEENKSLDEIANTVCPKVEYGREKIIRIIKDFLGEGYLIKHAAVLGYDVGKAQLAKKRKTGSHKKIDARTDSDSSVSQPIQGCCDNTIVCGSEVRPEKSSNSFSGDVHEAVRRLVEIFGINQVLEALASFMDITEETNANTKYPLNLDAIDSKNQGDGV
jgi:hypothetical protein